MAINSKFFKRPENEKDIESGMAKNAVAEGRNLLKAKMRRREALHDHSNLMRSSLLKCWWPNLPFLI